MLHVAGAFSPENARLSDATCTALQLANFWQDVARDLEIGRIYLPREDRIRFGYPDADLHARRFTPAFAELLRFEIARVRDLLAEGRALVPRIPGRLAIDVDLFSRGGSAILDRIEARRYDVLSSTPFLDEVDQALPARPRDRVDDDGADRLAPAGFGTRSMSHPVSRWK